MSTAPDLQDDAWSGLAQGSSPETVVSDRAGEDPSKRAPVGTLRPDEPVAWFSTEGHAAAAAASSEDEALAEALRAGNNRKVMEILVTVHGEHVYRYCRRILGGSEDSQDVAQTVFVQAFQCLEDLPSIRSVRGWLLRIARNRSLDRLKALRRSNRRLDHDLHDIVNEYPADLTVNKDPRVIKALDECLDRLDPKTRAVLVLRFHDGLSFHEISQLMSDTVGALRVRLVRALTALRHCLESKGVQL
ncbi:MAG TPA: RNA polymerase sigma factor [Kofleriaceae bacterium]|jgi:RNA polymerase sigma-70 factor (ECF subfamily)|nr:RNA polymerase sigma factor [Kofleriaceae bacterium]